MKTRKGTEDAKMLRQVFTDYPCADLNGHVVLDLGAHIGGFTQRALDEGAVQVIAVEPWPSNFALLQENISDARATLLNIGCGHKDLTFTAPSDRGTGGISGVIQRRQEVPGIQVSCVSLEDLVDIFRPTFIKLDIETAEYLVLPCPLPGVRELCGELHISSLEHKLAAFDLLKWFEEQRYSIRYLAGDKVANPGFRIMALHFHVSKRVKETGLQ